MRNRFLKIAAILGMTIATGCGTGEPPLPELAPVTGTVTQGGKPVADAIVTFQPEKGPLAVGNTDAAGKFELKYMGTNPGAAPGKYTVRISKMSGEAGDELIPRKYNEASKLTQEVTQAGPNDFKFEL
ncbi:Bacterial Ig-like domain (group 1) [Caulifigura coniformis]|uniref:Bacterial Ig-like domain (Group 1) n=1 Tax=Caulifigura coniformis TaxID=2527983 RepID=A0A517SCS2_9PLAN|nr:carboxypeptidase-like regulatory domain-containing protein [Caulifigura coniformis]QDT53932.1 Bacterial Ig-like domain (group 1) [Caulifigura coniformis]